MGASDTILGGTDTYSRHHTRNFAYSLGYVYTRLENTPGVTDSYFFNGQGNHGVTIDDAGTDSLANGYTGTADGSDCYTLKETFQDLATLSNNPVLGYPLYNIKAVGNDYFGLTDVGGSSQSGTISLASHSYSVAQGYGEHLVLGVVQFGNNLYTTGVNNDSLMANDDQSFGYGINASGSDSYSNGTSVAGWFGYGFTSLQSDSYHEQGTGNYIGTISKNYEVYIDINQLESTINTGSLSYSGANVAENSYNSATACESFNYHGTYDSGGSGTYGGGTSGSGTYGGLTHAVYSSVGDANDWTTQSEWTTPGNSTPYFTSGGSAFSESTPSGYNPGADNSSWIEKSQWYTADALNSTYQGFQSNFFAKLVQRLNNAYSLPGPMASPMRSVVVGSAANGVLTGGLTDPNGRVIIPSNLSVYRRGAAGTGGGTNSGSYSALGDSNGTLTVTPRTGGGTQNGLPAEEAANLGDFIDGTNRASTASADSPTDRAAQTASKPFQNYLRWGSSSPSGSSTMALRSPAGSYSAGSTSGTSGQNTSASRANASQLISTSGPHGSIFGYAGHVSDSLAMINAAPQANSIATAGTEGDTTVVRDPNGNVTSETNPLGEGARFAYNSAGRRTAVTDALGNVTSISYDPAGDVVSVTDPDGNRTTYDYDADGRLVRMTDPLGHSATYAYNAAGLLATTTDRDGRRRDFFYDAARQIIAENWFDPAGRLVDERRFGYDAAGRLVSASNRAGAYTFAYDSQGRLVRETEPFGLWLTFSYDASGNRTGLQDSFGGATVSTYDAGGKLVSRRLSAPGQETIGVTLDYLPNGEVDTLTRTAGGSAVGGTKYNYNGSGNVAGIAHLDASGDVLDGFVYAYDAANRLASESDFGVAENPVGPIAGASSPSDQAAAILASLAASQPKPGLPLANGQVATGGVVGAASGSVMTSLPGMKSPTGYSYDADGQVIGAGTKTYRYDANGNRINAGYVIGPDNQVLSDGTWAYSYDADGNRVGKTNLATRVSWAYGYDDANHMTSAVEYAADGKTILAQVTYAYDVFGNRLEEDTFTASTNARTVLRHGYDGQNVWADLDGSNNLETRYLHGDAVDEILARVGAGGLVAWYLTDRLGSVRDVVNDSGVIIDHRDYDAYGNIVHETNPAAGDRYAFTGREFDATTALQYNRARYYDPSAGRWTTQDAMGLNARDTNLYRYVGNNAVNSADPTGFQSWGSWFQDQLNVVGSATYAFGESIVTNVAGGVTSLVA